MTSRLFALMIAVAALALAGCGDSGGDDGDVRQPETSFEQAVDQDVNDEPIVIDNPDDVSNQINDLLGNRNDSPIPVEDGMTLQQVVDSR